MPLQLRILYVSRCLVEIETQPFPLHSHLSCVEYQHSCTSALHCVLIMDAHYPSQAKKKAAKKAAGGAEPAESAALTGPTESPTPAEPTPVDPPAEPTATVAKEEAGDDAEEGAAGPKSNKKKKKKKTAKKDEAPAPAAKKPTAALAAIKAAMEQKRLAEEEAKRREEEERQRIEEEERKAAEEERLKEEAKQRRKEKEKVYHYVCNFFKNLLLTFPKAKRELAKKEGRFLTKKQKEEKAAVEIRRKALLDSGVKIEGLQQQQNVESNGSSAPKKVVYGNRKKKSPAAVSTKDNAVPKVEEKVEAIPPPISEPVPLPTVESSGIKDDWEASEDEEDKAGDDISGVKDSWDASSDEDIVEKPVKPTTKGKFRVDL